MFPTYVSISREVSAFLEKMVALAFNSKLKPQHLVPKQGNRWLDRQSCHFFFPRYINLE